MDYSGRGALTPLSGQRTGFVAIIGAPNAGKSTLINALVQRKVSIVTHKVQTTRFPVRGVIERGASQIILIDTPGVFQPRRRLDKAMQHSVRKSIRDADAVLHVLDMGQWRRGAEEDRRVMQCFRDLEDIPVVLALNKLDRLEDKAQILPMTEQLAGLYAYRRVFMISALKQEGLSELVDDLAGLMPQGPWLYPVSAGPGAEEAAHLAAEITREKLMLRLHQELPYSLAVVPESWQQAEDSSVHIRQIILLAEARHKPIVIGASGKALAAVGKSARAEISALLQRPVHLFLHVKLARSRDDTASVYKQFGLEFDA